MKNCFVITEKTKYAIMKSPLMMGPPYKAPFMPSGPLANTAQTDL
jgi:hypothetical protein